MIVKSLLVWVVILPLAILNGALRELVLVPLLGGIALPFSGVVLCLLISGVGLLFLPRLGRGNRETYQVMGMCWVVATVTFESLLGIAQGQSIGEILAAYSFTGGNLWLLVVAFSGFVPWITAKGKKLY